MPPPVAMRAIVGTWRHRNGLLERLLHRQGHGVIPAQEKWWRTESWLERREGKRMGRGRLSQSSELIGRVQKMIFALRPGMLPARDLLRKPGLANQSHGQRVLRTRPSSLFICVKTEAVCVTVCESWMTTD